MILLLLLSSFCQCSKPEETQETYMLKIDEMPVDEAEVMVYAYQVYEEFINIGGEKRFGNLKILVEEKVL